MKKALILFLITCVIIISCTKTTGLINKNQLPGTSNKDALAGSWLLKQYEGGISYRVIVPADNITITFDESGKFSSSANFNIPAKGDYIRKNGPGGYHYSTTVINLSAEGYDKGS